MEATKSEAKRLEVIRSLFSQYYRSRPPIRVTSPEQREFGYWEFSKPTMVRHLAFRSIDDLLVTLARVAPLHAYRSSAYFSYPSAPMEEKGWLGADLVFDIDADHADPPCGGHHVFRVCTEHGLVEGESCGCGAKTVEVDWVCERCLEGARRELIKLVELLLGEFGVREEDVEVNFSGNRGFHVVVDSSELRDLDQQGRREIVQYLTAEGLAPEAMGFGSVRGRPRRATAGEPELDAYGWRGRIWRRIYARLSTGTDEDVGSALARMRPSEVRRLLDEVVREESVKIDPVVTADVHRLVRLSESLNGKTGLAVRRVPLERLHDFDPFDEAVAIRGRPMRVKVLYSPGFRLGGLEFQEVHGPVVTELPAHAAVYLVLKGLAVLE